jgi:protein SCO1/2
VGTFVTAAAQAGAEEGADQLGLPPMMHGTHLSHADYTLPGVQLVREDGRHVALKDELDDGHPVIVSFVYTSCSSLCPMISRTLSQLQGKLGAERDTVHLLSISIDPEQDTPQRLREYAAEVGAGAGWHHYTGTVAASVATQKAFNVYREDKMSHRPVLLMRAAPGKRWLRIDGFATADELLQAYRGMMAAN